MKSNHQITALLRLVDDPDDEVFDTVADQLLRYGKNIIPSLEQLWEITLDEGVQSRIELLIHRVHFSDLQKEFLEWAREKSPGLLRGAILIAKYKYPDLDTKPLFAQFEEIKRNIWLELNNYLTPLEQSNVLNSILFNYYKIEGAELTANNSDLFFINYLLESKKGNAYSIGILYLAICEIVDIPLFAVDLPRQFVLAYFDNLYPFFNIDSAQAEPIQQIQFYLDPMNGIPYTQAEVDVYLKKINALESEKYFQPLSNKDIICRMLEEMLQCYDNNNLAENADEMEQLIQLIKSVSKQ